MPAFGEWNYYYYSGELATPAAAAATSSEPQWYAAAAAAAPELEASSDVWFKYSPPPRVPPPSRASRKARRPEKMTNGGGGKRGLRHRAATPARASDAVVPSSLPRTPASKGGKSAAASAGADGARRVVRSVDKDLYKVPPPEFVADYDEEPRRWVRSTCARLIISIATAGWLPHMKI